MVFFVSLPLYFPCGSYQFKTIYIIFNVLKILDLGRYCLINRYYIKLLNEAFNERFFLIYSGFWLIFILSIVKVIGSCVLSGICINITIA